MYQLLSYLILPFSFSLLIILTGFVLWYQKFNERWGKIVAITGLCMLLFFSSYPGSYILLNPLEQYYPANPDFNKDETEAIVVLGGGFGKGSLLTPASRLNEGSLKRLLEAKRIHNEIPEAKLILSGYSRRDTISTAEMMLKLLLSLNLDTANVILLTHPGNTAKEAQTISELNISGNILLITSASHMPRAMMLFRKNGVTNITPLPVAHTINRWPLNLNHFLFTPGNLKKSNMAFHEYFGIIWGWVMN